MKIEPTYITFKQAKLLKEKGYIQKPTKLSEPYYNYNGELNGDMLEYIKSYVAKNKKDLLKYSSVAAPEQWKVVEWLRVEYGIWIEVGVGNLFYKDKFYVLIKKYDIGRWELSPLDNKTHSPYNSPQEAYSSAFDYTLKELI